MARVKDPSGYPPPSIDPPPPTSVSHHVFGPYVVLGGLVFSVLPLLITLVASAFIEDAFNEGTSAIGALPWLTFITLPISGIIVLIGQS